ncbi:MAG: T9SS type A sorting domain-containing protein [Saprospiraceae bacterium]|nr:T9SS type A sorting domain-containing protein [Saprospiraceae bacterium]
MRLLTTFIMGLLFIAQTNAQTFNINIDWIQNGCDILDSLTANITGGQGESGEILGEYNYVTYNYSCNMPTDTLSGTVVVYEKLDGTLAFTDFSFGVWGACFSIDPPSGSLNFSLVDNMITPLNGTDNYGDTWMFDAFTFENNSYMITFSSTYGDFGTTILTPSDGRTIPDLSGNDNGGTTSYTYQWSTGETTKTITINEEGMYSVIVSDDMGNMAIQSIEVSYSHPQIAAFETFYNRTNGDNWNRNDGWKEWMEGIRNCSPCFWEGVTCDDDGNVIRLTMNDNNLEGDIEDILFLFPDITNLEFSNNNLSGQIPDQINQLQSLGFLSLFNNNIEGTIPPTIGALNLFLLNLGANNIGGNIPPEMGNMPFLFFLNIEANQLFGQIPETFVNMDFLSTLNLSFNNLTGELPMPIGNPERMRNLFLSYNELSGPIPDAWGDYQRLNSVVLYQNQFSGEIPSSLLNSSNIEFLYLSDNNLSGCYPSLKSLDPCGIGFNDRDTLIELNGAFYSVYQGEGYNFKNNPLLPWEGDYEKFCDDQDQIGAPCDDNDPMTTNDMINEDCSCVGEIDSAVRDLEGISINIYPNPIMADLFVETEKGQGLKAELVNLIGQRIKTIRFNDANDISDIQAGVYFLRIENEHGQFIIEKLIKQ